MQPFTVRRYHALVREQVDAAAEHARIAAESATGSRAASEGRRALETCRLAAARAVRAVRRGDESVETPLWMRVCRGNARIADDACFAAFHGEPYRAA